MKHRTLNAEHPIKGKADTRRDNKTTDHETTDILKSEIEKADPPSFNFSAARTKTF